MVRKDYLVKAENGHGDGYKPDHVKQEILNILNTAFASGAIVEVKIIEGIDLTHDGKRFSKLRLDIISNTDFDNFD